MNQESDKPGAAIAEARRAPNWPRILLFGLVVLLICTVCAIWIFNEIALQKPLERVLASDPRNQTVTATAHFEGWIDTRSVVFDVTDLSGEATQADVFRVFLQYANQEKDRHFERVILAAFNHKKFIVPGDYFQQLGEEYKTQNPVYTLRTFPHHVRTMDGEQPYPEPSGGIFGVLAEEMEQFKDLNTKWYLGDFLARHK